MAQLRARITRTRPIPETIKPKPSWGRNFQPDAGFALGIKRYSMSVFIDRRLLRGDREARLALLKRDQIVARCISCVGEEWELHSEPTGNGRAGLVMYTDRGKALAAGVGQVGRTGEVNFSLATLYDGMTNRTKVTYKAEGKLKSDGSYEGTVSVSVEDPR